MINYSNVAFIKSAPSIGEAPKAGFPEILIVGKSNVGKSSLINALVNQHRLAFTSSKPGHTKLLNYYLIDNKFYLVDAPGYGYASGGVDLDALFGEMMDEYFKKATHLKLVLLLVDSRRGLENNDKEILDYVNAINIPIYIVLTKVDKINQKEKAQLNSKLNELGINKEDVAFTSSLKKDSLDSLKREISKHI